MEKANDIQSKGALCLRSLFSTIHSVSVTFHLKFS